MSFEFELWELIEKYNVSIHRVRDHDGSTYVEFRADVYAYGGEFDGYTYVSVLDEDGKVKVFS